MRIQSPAKNPDPSDHLQHFGNLQLKIHCCRYWQLSEWEGKDMAFPFWRLYHNSVEGAKIIYNNVVTELSADKIIIISPNTAYSNILKTDFKNGIQHEGVSGSKIMEEGKSAEIRAKKMVDHLYVHFNLGIPYDFVNPGIYIFKVNADLMDQINKLKNACINNTITELTYVMQLHSLITQLMSRMESQLWSSIKIDKRVFKVMMHISKNLSHKLENEELAKMANMACNSFARLFKQQMNEPVQHYIIKQRVEKSQLLLVHSDKNIDSIAQECGFCDRYHFSKLFKQIASISPANYRKVNTYEK